MEGHLWKSVRKLREGVMEMRELSAEDQARVERILDQVLGMAKVELRVAAQLLASKPNAEFFGGTEFVVRDLMHKIGARLFDAALEERKKGGTEVPAPAARRARRTRNSKVMQPR